MDASAGCRVGATQPLESVAKITIRAHLKGEPASFQGVGETNTRIAPCPGQSPGSCRPNFDGQRIGRFHTAGAWNNREDFGFTIQRGESEHRARAYARPGSYLRSQRSRPSLHFFGDLREGWTTRLFRTNF